MIRKIAIGDLKIGEEERREINKILDSTFITEGKKVREFEQKWAEFVGTKYSVLVNSGTSALIAGLEALKLRDNIPEGNKVITTPLTYIATVNSIKLARLQPVFVDVNSDDFSINTDKIEEHLESVKDKEKYSIVLPVHLIGYACDMDKINKIAKKYNLATFEDSAEAHGTLYKGKRVGSLSDISAFSFFVAHNVQVGEMGAVNTNDLELKRLVEKIKAHGRVCDFEEARSRELFYNTKFSEHEDHHPRYYHDIPGFNFKTMEFQPIIGLEQLKRIEWIIETRHNNVKYLNDGLKKYSDIIKLPIHSEEVSYLGYPLVIKRPDLISRKKLRTELEKNGIETRPLFGCIPLHQPAYAYLKNQYTGKLPNSEYLGMNSFYIGCHQFLTKDDLDYVIEVFDNILGGIK